MSRERPPSEDTWAGAGEPSGTWSDAPTDGPAAAAPVTPTPAYERFEPTGEVLGRGGLGIVDAVRDRDLGREVARKRLIADPPALRERFLREARITAQLEHPGIVPVYELGADASGKPFYVMRRIRGRTLGSALRDGPTLASRLRWLPSFITACQAVAYAHARGVIHRDLKPDNLMVGEFGETLVVDWGLAKADDEADVDLAVTGAYPSASGAHLTRIGATLGTPAYMSPEQARGETGLVDARSDVWGLGAILFELLAGRAPFAGLPGETAIERLRRGEFEGFAALAGAPTDLVAIVKKALHPDRDARYPHAGAIADDLVRWQTGGLVAAHDYSVAELIAKTVRRNPVVVGALALGAVAAVAVAGLSYLGIRAERDRAVVAEADADAAADLANGRLAASLAEAASRALERKDPITALVLGLGSLQIADSPRARGALVAATGDLPALVGVDAVPGGCVELAIARDGAVACWANDEIDVWESFPGPRVRIPLASAHTREAWRLEWSPSGRRLLAIHYDGRTYVWDRGGALSLTQYETLADGASFFYDDDHLIVADWLGRIGLFDLRTRGEPVFSKRRAAVRYDDAAVLDDGTVIIGSVTDPTQRWDPRTDTWTPALGGRVTPTIAASRDGRVGALSGGWGDAATPLWVTDAAGTREIDGTQPRYALTVSADGGRILAANRDDVTVWDAPDWEVSAKIPSDSPVIGAGLAPDGSWVVVAEADGDLRRWRLPDRRGRHPRDARGTVWDVRATEDGQWLVSAGNDAALRVWDAKTGALLREHTLDDAGLGYMETLGHDVVIAGNRAGLMRVRLDDGGVVWRREVDGTVNDVQRAPDGDLLVAMEGQGALKLSPDNALRWYAPVNHWVVSILPVGDEAWVAGHGGITRIALSDGHLVGQIDYPVLSDACLPTPDEGGAYVADLRGVVHIDGAGQVDRRLEVPYDGRVRSIERVGDRVFTGDDRGTVCAFAKGTAPLACWPAHGGVVWKIDAIPGRDAVATGGADGAVRIWDLAPLGLDAGAGLKDAVARFGLTPGDGQVAEAK